MGMHALYLRSEEVARKWACGKSPDGQTPNAY